MKDGAHGTGAGPNVLRMGSAAHRLDETQLVTLIQRVGDMTHHIALIFHQRAIGKIRPAHGYRRFSELKATLPARLICSEVNWREMALPGALPMKFPVMRVPDMSRALASLTAPTVTILLRSILNRVTSRCPQHAARGGANLLHRSHYQ
ncbi:hypothetical protein [uncultured Stenotrophomonas sp.]|uniref:hypothetical protein n=1 Tax=uncultured Stenotrophomonas sp. TaxID=165438 RepID=UPI0028D18D64|nr:hypothetical protein [uncultured Stenotrophomonas sp.]